ncbi:HAD-IB family hydrolase [Acinetobacter sp. CFCC 10889]|uniref:HAD-IB family hydrolase n=1 Tax=Acinetobacter sp. CFCC 10889 TaxID=1775557 RepID=UPI000DD06464|nr:HAD-IB family hydrolase [Acinetobacter sp. CFCC 10889]
MQNIAFFDFDGTITTTDTFTPFIHLTVIPKTLNKGKILLAPYIIGYKLDIVSGSVIRSKIFKFGFKGRLEQELIHIGSQYCINFIPKVIRGNAMERIEWHKAQGDRIVIVSASIDLYLKPWCEKHKLELLCSEVESINGVLTGKYQNKDCSGMVKKERILKNYDLSSYKEIYVYGDTIEDNDMLSLGTIKFYRWKQLE